MTTATLDKRPPLAPLPWGRWSLRSGALIYLGSMLIIPLLVILHDDLRAGLGEFWHAVTLPIAWHALLLTLWTSALMAAINAVMGTLTAYVLVRYDFPGKPLLNAVVDLPLAIPTLVTGVMLVVLFGPQQALGAWLSQRLGINIIFAPPGIILALLFITFPFVVRAIQPVLQDLDREPEAAAATLGAGGWTTFRRVILPALSVPILSGTLLSFARGIGEFGAIVIVAGNIPFQTQTAAVYVLGEIESSDQLGASAMSVVLLAIAFGLIVLVGLLQRRSARRTS
ncbi:MAG: Sulfate transport system permease protein CysT [Ktedonobacterales bacterium]|jgi:sulfate transport system permease protein|nr:MAG: Sulfate transport system permease protein CysT [Ktedonobacterales bacterium]